MRSRVLDALPRDLRGRHARLTHRRPGCHPLAERLELLDGRWSHPVHRHEQRA